MTLRGNLAISFLAAALFATGCGDVGSVGNGNGDDNFDPDTVGTTCIGELSVTGNFQPAGTGVSEDGDCVPMGTWTLEVEVSDQGDCSDIPVVGEYVYDVTQDDDGYLVVYRDDPNGAYSSGKITIEGPCQGNFEHFSNDGLQYTVLRPYTMTDFTIGGVGSYEVYEESQL